MDANRPGLKAKLLREVREMLVVFLYLAAFFCTFTAYRRLLMDELAIGYFHYGFALIKALVLAKVIVLGRHIKLSKLLEDRPLVVPTVYKVIVFSLFTLLFEILEHVVDSALHGHGVQAAVAEILGVGRYELLARTLVTVFAFLPLFAFGEIGRVLGEGQLRELFFRRSTSTKAAE